MVLLSLTYLVGKADSGLGRSLPTILSKLFGLSVEV
jgi:hypothetical protein